MILPTGLHDVPKGHIAAVVTSLQMTSQAIVVSKPFPSGFKATQETLDNSAYRALFREIGTPYLWTSRLLLDDDALHLIISDARVETWIVRQDGAPIGLIELDFRVRDECELVFFGLVPSATGQGLGGPMIALAQSRAFANEIKRFHVHTCTLDAPLALPFYQKAGFEAHKVDVEIFTDPRLMGTYPRSTASHIPCLP